MAGTLLGVPLFLGILGGTPEHWAQYGRAYRDAWAQVDHPADAADIAVAVHGFVGDDDRQAKATYLEHELRMFATGAAEIGRPPMALPGRAAQLEPGGMVFAGRPDEVADRILHLHAQLGHNGIATTARLLQFSARCDVSGDWWGRHELTTMGSPGA